MLQLSINKIIAMGLHEAGEIDIMPNSIGRPGSYYQTDRPGKAFGKMYFTRVPGGILYTTHFSKYKNADEGVGVSDAVTQTMVPIPMGYWVAGVDLPDFEEEEDEFR
jgi:hypothetical protein